MSKIQEKLSNPAVFLSIYLVTVLATYILPYFGSNSWAGAQLISKSGGNLVYFYFWFTVHTLCYAVMGFLAFKVGKQGNKTWLVTFPILGAIFDLAPTINMIPLVASVLNIVGLVIAFKTLTALKQKEHSHTQPIEVDQAA